VSEASAIVLERAVRWRPAFRIIPSRYPPIDLFERIADPADWEALIALESLTNSRLRDQAGEIRLVPIADRISGPGASIIMAPFTHLAPAGTRFTDSTFGAYYAGESVETAIAETRHHREVFLRATREPPIDLEMRCYLADIDASLHDLRGRRGEFPALYDRDSYAASQPYGRRLRERGANGIVYESVRRDGGECTAVFRPRLVKNFRQGAHLRYQWDGARIARVHELRPIEV
jgi:hypothetical protein